MGTLDGAGISYLRREADEMASLEALGNEGKYPTFAIEKVNHAQVSSGKQVKIIYIQ